MTGIIGLRASSSVGPPTGGTTLETPASGTRGAAYFLKVIDGGSLGYSSLAMTMLADDAAMIYLNGQLIGVKGALTAGSPDHWNTCATAAATETDYSAVTLIGSPVVPPGPSLLAISLHQSAANSSDLGFRMALTGTAGIPLLYGAAAGSIGQNSAAISWSTWPCRLPGLMAVSGITGTASAVGAWGPDISGTMLLLSSALMLRTRPRSAAQKPEIGAL